ncbi:MAG: hypothetical protein HC828_04735 [Blastochloris sp.]|nr:hypothetical protein [Blastochloris sp.]
MVSRSLGGLFLPGGGYASGGKAVLRYGDDVARHADDAWMVAPDMPQNVRSFLGFAA